MENSASTPGNTSGSSSSSSSSAGNNESNKTPSPTKTPGVVDDSDTQGVVAGPSTSTQPQGQGSSSRRDVLDTTQQQQQQHSYYHHRASTHASSSHHHHSSSSSHGLVAGNQITLNISTTTGGNFSVTVDTSQSVDQLKKSVAKKLRVSKDRICLLHRERYVARERG